MNKKGLYAIMLVKPAYGRYPKEIYCNEPLTESDQFNTTSESYDRVDMIAVFFKDFKGCVR